MKDATRNIVIEQVKGKPYSKVEDDERIYFIPTELSEEVHEYVKKRSFGNRVISSIKDWYLSLSMDVRKRILVVLEQKIA
ncbi:MAG TPA: hypothetical protein VJT83_00815 [Chitinophagaceae bacterium]|nr:hypothetical protein [Chitinophagaceae bacterium]